MLFRELRLIAFGRFEDQTVALAPGFNVVCGPNEAGKSTTLRAIRSLLFGFEKSTADDFRFPYNKLRVGASLSSGNGAELVCVRRKANKDDLRRGDDAAVLPPAEWNAVVPPLDAAAFDQQFGVTYNSLLDGGAALAAGKGDLATALFTAAAGTNRFRKLREGLAERAEELFKPRAQKPTLNLELSAARTLRDKINESSLSASTWEQHERDRQSAEQGAEYASKRLREIETRLALVERQVEAAPLIVRRDALQANLEGLRTAKRLAEDFPRRRQEAQRQVDRREAALGVCRQHLERLQREAAEVDAPQELLAREREVEELLEKLGSHRQAALDLPVRAGELQQIEHEVRRGLQDLGRGGDAAAAGKLQIPEPVRMRIERLAAEGTERLALERQLRDALADLEARRRQARRALEETADEPDAVGLRQTVKRLGAQANLEAQLQKARRALSKEEEQLAALLQRLGLGSLPLARFALLPLPAPETVRRMQSDEEQLRARVEAAQKEKQRLQAELRKLEQERQLLGVEDVPDERRLETLRRERDLGWALLRGALAGSPPRAAEEAAFLAGPPRAKDLADAFERRLAELDRTVDGLLAHADKLSQRRVYDRRSGALAAAIEEASQAEAVAGEAAAAWRKGWLETWAPIGVAASAPAEMLEWLRDARAGRDRLAAHAQNQGEAEELATQLAAVKAEALAAFPADQRASREKTPLGRLLDELEAVVQERDLQRQKRQDAEREASRAEQEYERRREKHAEALEQVEGWRRDWAQRLGELSVEPDLTPSQATTLLARMQELVHKNDLAEEKRGRIAAMRGFMSDFEERTSRFLHASAADLAPQPLETALPELQRRLRAAQAADSRLRQLREQTEREQEKERGLVAERTAAQKELDSLVREAGCTAVDGLPEAEQRSAERARAEEQREQLDSQLDRLARGAPREEFVAACRRASVEALEEEAAALRQERDDLSRQLQVQLRNSGELKAKLAAMNGSATAADLQADLKAKLAGVLPLAEEYARIRLAEFLLKKTLEEYSRKHKDPVVDRAGAIFRELTCGRFEGLAVEAGPNDQPILKGVRAGSDGACVDVAGMSTGSRDQLFLALRIATLEIYFQEHPPIPVIVDDILVMFDDERAAAALRVLRRLAQSTQVLYFTHHEHLLEVLAGVAPDAHVVRLQPSA